ncbi:MAG: DUF523 domain-containing protein [Bdellovibrionota bacterium]|jgi:uncharacterized protein YbbK (DUF523 family)|nr:DUF523 domain-containing protein [Bdellovibrionota bacterium]
MKIVSACLAGVPCRYDGQAKPRLDLIELVQKGEAIALCPEELGDLGTPRPPCENVSGKILTQEGEDKSEAFHRGAQIALAKTLKVGATEAILKSCSPMCGVGKVYDGTFSGTLTTGDGVFTQLLKQHGIKTKERD